MSDDFGGSSGSIGQQGQPVTVEYRVSIITNPVAQIDIPAPGISQRIVDRQMPVPKNKIIEIFLPQHFLAVNDQPFLFLPQEPLVDLPGNRPAAAAEPAGDANPHRGGQDAEKPLTS